MNIFYNDLKIYFETFGERKRGKTPIVFLHGWGGSTKSFEFFAQNMKSKNFCILIDFPPFGKSGNPRRPLDLNDYTNIVLKVLKFLRIKKINIVAHSFGGRVAINISSSRPNIQVEKLVLTGSAGLKKKSLKNFFKIKRYKFLKLLSKLNLYSKSRLETFGSNDYKSLNDVMKKTFLNIINFDQKKFLKKIKSKTLLIWGSEDTETPFYFTKIFKKNIKESEVIVFQNCSHFAYIERPKTFLKIISSFLN